METMFVVRVWDNFHYMDEGEAYDAGTFATYEEALAAAKRIVELSVAEFDYDYEKYVFFGEDPGIIGEPKGELFSAREYAKRVCEERR
jgi:hypothetical protein